MDSLLEAFYVSRYGISLGKRWHIKLTNLTNQIKSNHQINHLAIDLIAF